MLCLFSENDYSALSNSLYNMSREPTPIILIVNNAAASCSELNVCKLEPTVSWVINSLLGVERNVVCIAKILKEA